EFEHIGHGLLHAQLQPSRTEIDPEELFANLVLQQTIQSLGELTDEDLAAMADDYAKTQSTMPRMGIQLKSYLSRVEPPEPNALFEDDGPYSSPLSGPVSQEDHPDQEFLVSFAQLEDRSDWEGEHSKSPGRKNY